MNDWAQRAAGLAEELVTAGKLRSPEWIAAIRAVPRHKLVPVVYEQEPSTGAWFTRDATDPIWQELVYANQGLFTKVGEAAGSWGTAVVGLSSSSTPGLMTRPACWRPWTFVKDTTCWRSAPAPGTTPRCSDHPDGDSRRSPASP